MSGCVVSISWTLRIRGILWLILLFAFYSLPPVLMSGRRDRSVWLVCPQWREATSVDLTYRLSSNGCLFIFYNYYNFQQFGNFWQFYFFGQFLQFVDNFDNFDWFGQFWQFLTIVEFCLTILKCFEILTSLTILTIWKIFFFTGGVPFVVNQQWLKVLNNTDRTTSPPRLPV